MYPYNEPHTTTRNLCFNFHLLHHVCHVNVAQILHRTLKHPLIGNPLFTTQHFTTTVQGSKVQRLKPIVVGIYTPWPTLLGQPQIGGDGSSKL